MTTTDEIMVLAEKYANEFESAFYEKDYTESRQALREAIAKLAAENEALRAALAEPAEQEPDPCPQCKKGGVCRTPKCGRLKLPADHPFRAAPQPVMQPLTDEEIRDLWSWSATAEAERTASTQQHAFARAVIAAYEAKNGIKE